VLPRRPGDFERNDDVYAAVESSERQLTRLDPAAPKIEKDGERVERSAEDMAAEARLLRAAMP
jgi:bis(5'-adenosyl)-triphosphatase